MGKKIIGQALSGLALFWGSQVNFQVFRRAEDYPTGKIFQNILLKEEGKPEEFLKNVQITKSQVQLLQ